MSGFAKLFPWLFASQEASRSETVASAAESTAFEHVDPRDCGLVDAVMSGWFLNDSGELLRGFPIDRGDIVLDFGCGDGDASLFAARQGAEVIFADTDAEKIATLESKMHASGAPHWRSIVCGDIGAGVPLPVADGSVGKVIAMEVLEHVSDPELVLRELVRVAAPGAKVLVSVPDAAGERLQASVASPAHFREPNHIHVFDRGTFEKLILDSGLAIEQKHYAGFFWTLGMCFYWAALRDSGKMLDGSTRDAIAPPFHPLLDQWARTWKTLIDMPEGAKLKAALDELLPKSQIIIARKPL